MSIRFAYPVSRNHNARTHIDNIPEFQFWSLPLIPELQHLFRIHETGDEYRIFLVHKHFDVHDGEMFVRMALPNGNVLAEIVESSKVHAAIATATCPEIDFMSAKGSEEVVPDEHRVFVDAARDVIVKHDLQSVLGLVRVTDDGLFDDSPYLEETDEHKRTHVFSRGLLSQFDPRHVVQTEWSMSLASSRGCAKYCWKDYGPHRRLHESTD